MCLHLRWTVGQWGECSQTCGEGVRTRPVTCMQLMTEGDEVVQDDSECSQDDKPETQQDCNLQRCPAIWHIFEWSEVRIYVLFFYSFSYVQSLVAHETLKPQEFRGLAKISLMIF